MFGDKEPEVREHGAFAITQTKSPRIAPDLIRLGNTDKAGEVRAQAWFWLAQTGAAESENAIGAALRKDSDDRVREQAIFALSQLPDERATRALIATAEDQSLSREQRKRAVFWLAQSEATGAQAYLEKVLAGNMKR
jgi:HEAT repeat protein